jgi:SNF2 family DNA or RNA helicase
MQFRPHDYQKYAVQFIKDHPVSALFLQMGLGKSVITLTAINDMMFDSFEISKVLVIAPIRVCQDTWPKEIRKWDHLSGLRYSVAVGSEKERLEALCKDADIYILNRENVQWLVEKTNIVFDYDCIVIDELSSFKNHQSKRFRALMKVRPKVKRVIGLTGTPSSNGLMDLWAQFRILDMGERLGRYITRYRLKWFQPDRRNGMQVFSYKPLPGAEEGIYEAIGDITVSMKSTDHLDMPECIFSERTVHLDEGEKRFYSSLKDELVAEWQGFELTASNAAVLSGKLLQLANGMVYGDDGSVEIHSRKLDALEDIVEEANGNPLLVAYWFRHDYERISERLRKLGVVFLDLRSEDAIAKWNRKELAVGLIHPASAGHGLNLQEGGDTIVWYGPIWSLELYEQTNGRLWRQGQKSSTVVVQHIVAEGTIDEKVMFALQGKSDVQVKLMDAVKAEVRG